MPLAGVPNRVVPRARGLCCIINTPAENTRSVNSGLDPFVLEFTGAEGDPGSNNQKNVWPSRYGQWGYVGKRIKERATVTRKLYVRDPH